MMLHEVSHPPFQAKQKHGHHPLFQAKALTLLSEARWITQWKSDFFFQRPRVVFQHFDVPEVISATRFFFGKISQNARFELHPCKFCLLPLSAYIPQVKA